MSAVEERYDFTPLARYLAVNADRRWVDDVKAVHFESHPGSESSTYATAPWLAKRCGVSTHIVRRWTTKGLTLDEADTVCTRLGLHISEMWPEYYAVSFEPA